MRVMLPSGRYPWLRDALLNAPIEGSGGVRYHLRSSLGEGGQGLVYRANYDERDGFWVVVKLLRPDVGHEDAETRFRREAEVLRLLGQLEIPSPHIVRCFDHAILSLSPPGGMGEPVLLPFTVLEYVHGPTLAELLAQHTGYGLAVGRVRRLFRQLTRALSAIHKAKIVHRDLKPSNVLLAQEHGREVVKITDFGLVKRFDVELRATIAIAGASVGYAPPEQFEQGNRRVSNRTDLFAYAAMLFEALTGALPFAQSPEDTSMQVISRMMTGPPPRIAHFLHRAAPELAARGDIVKKIDEKLERALAPNPDERPASVDEFWSEIEPLLAEVELSSSEQSDVPVPGSMAFSAVMFDEPSISIRTTPNADDIDVNSATSHQAIYESETRSVVLNIPADALPLPGKLNPAQAPGGRSGLNATLAGVHRIMMEPPSAPATHAGASSRPRQDTAPVPAMREPPVFRDAPTPMSGGVVPSGAAFVEAFGPHAHHHTPVPSSSPSSSSPPVSAGPPSRIDAFASTHGAGGASTISPYARSNSAPPPAAAGSESGERKRGMNATTPMQARPAASSPASSSSSSSPSPSMAYSSELTAVRPPPAAFAAPTGSSVVSPAPAARVRVITASALPERARAACFSPDGSTAFALGARGVYVLDNARWVRLDGLDEATAAEARGILCTPAREVVVYGDNGLFGGIAWGGRLREWTARDRDISWVAASLAPNEILLVGNHSSRDLPIVGSLGVGAPLSMRVVERCPKLLDGTRLPSGSLLAVSVAGDPVCVSGEGIVPVSWPRTGALRAAVATPDGGGYVVGLGGHVLRVDPRLSSSLEVVHTTKDLYQVVVSNTGVAWAGGLGASLVRRTQSGWLRVHLPDATKGAVLTIAARDHKAHVVLDDGVVVEAELTEAATR
jgi:serine/threonine protein kinase